MERGSIYPSWRYHADGRSVLCLNAAHDAELGDEWSDTDIRDFSTKDVIEGADDVVPASDAPAVEPKKKPGRKPKA